MIRSRLYVAHEYNPVLPSAPMSASRTANFRPAPIWQRWATVFCLWLFFAMVVNTSLSKNPTTDEPVHFSRGIAIWQGQDLRLQQEHTPLSHWFIGALAHSDSSVPDITTRDGWDAADRLRVARHLVWGSGLHVDRLFFLARFPIGLMGVIMAAVVVQWAGGMAVTQKSRSTAQLLAALIMAASPNLIAHASLATTDFMATVGYVLAIWGWWHAFKDEPTWGKAVVAGLLLGVGLASKVTGVLLGPITLLLTIAVWRLRLSHLTFAAMIKYWGAMLPSAGLTVWAIYRFTLAPVYLPFVDLSPTLPAPAYVNSILGVFYHIEGGHKAFFWGEISNSGWLLYFPAALLLKTPLITLGAALWSAGQGLFKRRYFDLLILWLPAVLLFSAAVYSRLNIGYRHILPVIPFLIVSGAIALAPYRRVAITLGLAAVLVTVWQQPHHLAYFNLLAGGSAGGANYFGDSNLDWGQDWKTAISYVNSSEVAMPTYIAPFGFVDPNYYAAESQVSIQSILDSDGFASPDFAPANPAPGRYLLSVNALQGILAQPDLLDWFKRQEPIERRAVGYSIYAYEVNAAASGDWIAQCSDPVPLLDPAVAAQIVNAPDARQLQFDCRTSWLFPNGGRPGWYILPRDGTSWLPNKLYGEHFIKVYSHDATVFAPAYEVFYWTGQTDLLTPFTSTASHYEIGQTAALVAYTQTESEWQTVWRVLQADSRPLSVLAHLYYAADAPPQVADGLGYPIQQWRTDDFFIQRHPFTPPTQPLYLETGLYDYTNGERLAAGDNSTEIQLQPLR